MASVPMSPVMEPRRVPPLGAFLEGWRRVLQAPAVVFGIAIAVGTAAVLVDTATFGAMGFRIAQATSPIGAGSWAVGLRLVQVQLEQLSRLLAPEFAQIFHPESMPLSWIAGQTIKAVLWMFLTGGALDRLARGRPIRTAAFFGACGVYFFRFLRLALIVGIPIWALLRWHGSSAVNLYAQVAVVLAVAVVGLVLDFARVRAVVEDRRSMIGAIAAAVRFVRRRVWRVLGLALLNAVAILIVLRVQFQVAMTPAGTTLAVVMFAGVVILAVAARLAVMAAEVVFFQGELAHAGYTAAALPVWPDSPAVEAMENLVKRSSSSPPR
jgi:hypothetical protein